MAKSVEEKLARMLGAAKGGSAEVEGAKEVKLLKDRNVSRSLDLVWEWRADQTALAFGCVELDLVDGLNSGASSRGGSTMHRTCVSPLTTRKGFKPTS
jgi:hypothetical protein